MMRCMTRLDTPKMGSSPDLLLIQEKSVEDRGWKWQLGLFIVGPLAGLALLLFGQDVSAEGALTSRIDVPVSVYEHAQTLVALPSGRRLNLFCSHIGSGRGRQWKLYVGHHYGRIFLWNTLLYLRTGKWNGRSWIICWRWHIATHWTYKWSITTRTFWLVWLRRGRYGGRRSCFS